MPCAPQAGTGSPSPEAMTVADSKQDLTDNASDLYSWLPSYDAAKHHHGHRANKHIRSPAAVMKEASLAMAAAQGYQLDREEIEEWFSCGCGEHPEDAETIGRRFQNTWRQRLKIRGEE